LSDIKLLKTLPSLGITIRIVGAAIMSEKGDAEGDESRLPHRTIAVSIAG
jgi:hypothetical protein